MPGKSRQVPARHAHSKRRKGKKRALAVSGQQPVNHAYEHAPAPTAKPATPDTFHPPTRQATREYHYVAAELRKIGILAGAIFVILIALSFVLG